jgi:N-acetylmuramoyl-L-alanine amidase
MLRLSPRLLLLSMAAVLPAAVVPAAASPPVRLLYERALQRDQAIRATLARETAGPRALANGRDVIASYERVVRMHPRSGYCDNALWQAAELASALWSQFSEVEDRQRALRLYRRLVREYPHSPLVPRTRSAIAGLDTPPVHRAVQSRSLPGVPTPAPAGNTVSRGAKPSGLATVRDIRRTVLPNVVRVTVELDREVPFREERITNPDRVFVDLQGVRTGPDLRLPQYFQEGFVKQIRLGQHPDDTVRVVLDVEDAARHSVFTLYSPYRLVIDCERRPSERVALPPEPQLVPTSLNEAVPTTGVIADLITALPPSVTKETPPRVESTPRLPRRESPVAVPTGPPAVNLRGRFSLSRQLGLGVARIVIDPGHGGHDPGAQHKNLTEAALVLDVALRLEQLLSKQPSVEVVLTRRTDTYVPLEERTAVANREDADLFLSIHANASRNRDARGVETYFLNFATTRDAEAVAARENATSDQNMRRLPTIVKAITLNDKVDESRDFATFVQRAMIQRLRSANREVRDLGVKQAPFVVLIGAGMPSVLAEISFLTNSREHELLQTPAYRQRVAEALLAGVLRYQKSLKSVKAVARSAGD